jgi:hypothetical protein
MEQPFDWSDKTVREKALQEALEKINANFPNQGKGSPLMPQPDVSDIDTWGKVTAKNIDEFNLEISARIIAHDFEDAVQSIAREAASVLIKKHQDYGPDNINNAPGGAMNGLLVRMHDKMERLKTLIIGNKTPKYESIEDTLIDTINYSIIALMVLQGKWPE